jgi:hypothetical protein
LTADIRLPKDNSTVQTFNSSLVLMVTGHESHTEYSVIVNKVSRALLVLFENQCCKCSHYTTLSCTRVQQLGENEESVVVDVFIGTGRYEQRRRRTAGTQLVETDAVRQVAVMRIFARIQYCTCE